MANSEENQRPMSTEPIRKKTENGSRKTTKTRASAKNPRQQKAEQAFYVYCIGEHTRLAPLFENRLTNASGAVETDYPLELMANCDLAAVVSAVPLADYNEIALQDHLADPQWTANRAMRHQTVMEHFAAGADVAPLRFGTIYLSREPIMEMLAQRQDALKSLLSRLRGREEWSISVYRDGTTLMKNLETLSVRLREAGERAALASPGQAYLLRKKMDSMRADEARAETNRVVTEIEADLGARSDGTTRLRLLKDEKTEHGELVAKLAFLVARARFNEFRDTAVELAQRYRVPGFTLEMVGPWPAYNFATAEL